MHPETRRNRLHADGSCHEFAEDRPGSVARTLRYPTWHPRTLTLVYRHCLGARASTGGAARSINIERAKALSLRSGDAHSNYLGESCRPTSENTWLRQACCS